MTHHQNDQQRIRLLCLLLCGLFCLFGCKEKPGSDSQQPINYTTDKPFYKGPLRVRVRLSDQTIKLSDLLAMELSAEIDPD